MSEKSEQGERSKERTYLMCYLLVRRNKQPHLCQRTEVKRNREERGERGERAEGGERGESEGDTNLEGVSLILLIVQK